MPRFNFKAYLRKTSSTEFSSLHDVHPQAEWEEKHAEQSPEPVTETSDGNALASLESTATPLIGPQLPYEYDALSYDDSAIGSIGEMMDDSSIDYDNVSVDTCTSPEPKGQGGRNLDNIQEKKFEDQNSHYSLEANQSAVVNISIRESVTTPAAEPRTIKTEPNQSMEGQQVSALMYLDNENCLHPVRHTNEINGVVQISRPQKLPLACPEALTRVENIPFEQLAHFTQLGDYVRDLQADERICDVTVHIGTEKYAAHRISLACYSDYFADIFYNQKDTLVPINIRLNDITPMAFEVLLQYIYSGVLPVTSEVVGDLMTMAESLRIPMVRNIVIDYMKHLPLTHALAIVMKGKLFGPLYANTMEAVCGLFNTFTLEDVFLDMDIETILIILNNDNLNISSELDVFKAAMRWIAHDIVDRNQHFLKLMKCIRFPFMTQDELFQCNEFTDLLKENNECMKMFLEATWIVTARNLGKDDPFHLVVPKPRITATTPWGDNDDFYNLIGNVHVNEKSPESTPGQQTISGEKWTGKQRNQTISGEPRHQAIRGEKWAGKQRHQTISGEPRHQTISGEKWTGKTHNQTISGETPISDDKWSEPPRVQTIKDEKRTEKQRHQTISGEPRHQTIIGEKWTGKPRHQTISGEPRHQAISGEKWTGKSRNQTISGETPISDDKYSEPPREQTRKDEKWTEKQRNQTISGEPRHQTISGEKWTGKPRSQTISGEPRHQTISGEKLTGKRRNQTISGEKWTEKPLNQTKSCEKTISGEKSGRSNTTGEIIAVGGAITAKTIDIYHSDDNKWKHYCDLPEPRRHFSVTMQNGKVYLTGGIDPRFKVKHPVPTSDAFVFDTKNYMWIKIMPMNTARMNHSSASVNGMVYAIGGQDGNDRVLNTVECYNPKTDNWFFINPMSEARHSVATGVIDDMIFTVGGYGESIGQASEMPVLDTVECYDPQENIWDRKCNLRFPRCYCNLVSVNDTLYLCGGATRSFNSSNSVISSVQSIDTYNKEQDVWEHCTDMVIPRHAAGTASLGTFIYIIGGASTQSKRNLSSVECFDTDTKKWISGVKDIPHPSKWIKCLSLN